MVWYSHLFQNFPQFIVIHTVKGFGIVNKAEIDVFLAKQPLGNAALGALFVDKELCLREALAVCPRTAVESRPC